MIFNLFFSPSGRRKLEFKVNTRKEKKYGWGVKGFKPLGKRNRMVISLKDRIGLRNNRTLDAFSGREVEILLMEGI